MGKPKHLLKSEAKPKGKRPQPAPETADEYLEAGVDFESAGEKWRAGDAAKSCRFFGRAIDTYQAGLQRFPPAFDLAYNKARVQFDLSQQPRLMQHSPTPPLELLRTALASHRYALNLKPGDADTLFNTAQVLTSIGDALTEGPAGPPEDRDHAVSLFQEALVLFEKCLLVQESQYAESQAQLAELNEASFQGGGADPQPQTGTPSSPVEERWASIVEPVTRSTLLDTCIAQIQALTTITPLVGAGQSAVQNIESVVSRLLDKAATYLEDDNTSKFEFHHSRANLVAAVADASFRTSLITAQTYSDALTSTFTFPGIETSAPALCDLADAIIAFNASLALLHPSDAALARVRWQRLSSALSALESAAALPDAPSAYAIQARRGDTELLRARLAEPPLEFGAAASNRGTLLKNAETFYRGAANLAKAGEEADIEREMRGKEAVVKVLRGDKGKESLILEGSEGILEEMKGEGLIGEVGI